MSQPSLSELEQGVCLTRNTSRPVLDDQPIPVIHAAERARIPESWLANAHRAQV
jgi:hypothetical protein